VGKLNSKQASKPCFYPHNTSSAFIILVFCAMDSAEVARATGFAEWQVQGVLRLFGESCTVPFITRYRQEATGGLDEVQIRAIQTFAERFAALAARKKAVLKAIEKDGKLNDRLRKLIQGAETLQEIEDLYAPFKSKRRTRAEVALEQGLGAIAQKVWNGRVVDQELQAQLRAAVQRERELSDVAAAQLGVKLIMAQWVAEDLKSRKYLRRLLWQHGQLQSTEVKATASKASKEKKAKPAAKPVVAARPVSAGSYADFSRPLGRLLPHQTLAINRAEKQKVVRVAVSLPPALTKGATADCLRWHTRSGQGHGTKAVCSLREDAVAHGLLKQLLPSLVNECRKELKETAEAHATDVFATNLRQLLMAPGCGAASCFGNQPPVTPSGGRCAYSPPPPAHPAPPTFTAMSVLLMA
jgi:uncharacterized protein